MERISWRILLASMATIFALVVAGCGSVGTTSGGSTGQPASKGETGAAKPAIQKEPIKIGLLASLTGAWAAPGTQQKNVVEMAVRDLNAKGGVDGAMIELVVEDDKSTPEVGVSATEKLITRDKVITVGGSYSSGVTLTALKVATRLEVPILPWGVANEITEQGSKYVFRIGQTASDYADGMVRFAKEEIGASTVALIYSDDAYGTSTAKSLKEFAEKAGLKIVADQPYSPSSVDLSPVIIKIKAARPDAVLAVANVNDAKLIATQSHQLDFNTKAIIGGGGGFASSEFIEGAGKDSEYVFNMVDWMPDARWLGAKDVYEQYQKEYGRPMNLGNIAEVYVYPFVVADAIKRAGGTADKAKLRDAFAATDMKETMYGPIKFDAKGQNAHPVLMAQIQGGKFTTVWPKDLASASFKQAIPWDKR